MKTAVRSHVIYFSTELHCVSVADLLASLAAMAALCSFQQLQPAAAVKCSLHLMSGDVLETTWPALGDKLSIGHFFNLAKTKLGVSECDIKLVIGKTHLSAEHDAWSMFFDLQEVKHAIAEHMEVKIYVVRLRERDTSEQAENERALQRLRFSV